MLKSRQLGFTTEEAIDMLDDVLFTRNFNGLFIAQDLDTAKDIFSNKIELAWKNYPLQHFYKVDNNSARQIKFDFGDGTVSSITVDSSGRSGTFNRLHVTEFAQVCRKYPDKAKEIIEGSIPAIPLEGRADIESTADGDSGLFYDLFWEAWNRGAPTRPVEFKAHFFNWTYEDEEINLIHPENVPNEFKTYQLKHNLTDRQITFYYYKWLSLNKNWESLRKEYPTTPEEAFAYSGVKLFNQDKLAELKKNAIEGDKQGDWIYYESPRLNHRYVAGVDVSEGVGQDSSTIVILDFTPLKPKLVAIYANNHIASDMLAYEIKNGCSKYSMAFVAVERNNHGHATISKLKEIYPEEYIYQDQTGKYGWLTTLTSKPKMLFDLKTAIDDDLLEINSKQVLSEMMSYDKEELNKNRFDPEVTRHYDLLMATAIAFQMKNEFVKLGSVESYKPKW